jgi:hypothetical protein
MDHMGLDSRVMPNDHLSGVMQRCVALLLDSASWLGKVQTSELIWTRQ